MPSRLNETLQQQRFVTERRHGLSPSGCKGGRNLAEIVDDVHAFSTPASRRFDDEGQADVSCLFSQPSVIGSCLAETWDHR